MTIDSSQKTPEQQKGIDREESLHRLMQLKIQKQKERFEALNSALRRLGKPNGKSVGDKK